MRAFARGIVSKAGNTFAAALLDPDAKSVRNDRLTYLSPRKIRRLQRALDRTLADGVRGDVVEFGVALGGSSILLARAATRAGRTFCGFDVFSMIPAPGSDKDDEKSRERYEVISAGQSEGIAGDVYYGYRPDLYAEVCRSFARYELPVDGRAVVLHKGYFEETWPQCRSDTVAFAHIDCDWYEPVSFSLAAVHSRLAPGGRIVLDDYNDYGGCRAATEEFLAACSCYDVEGGANIILRRK